jgi:hypothetical protein
MAWILFKKNKSSFLWIFTSIFCRKKKKKVKCVVPLRDSRQHLRYTYVFAGKAEFAFFYVKKEEKGVSFVIVCKQHVSCVRLPTVSSLFILCVCFFFLLWVVRT